MMDANMIIFGFLGFWLIFAIGATVMNKNRSKKWKEKAEEYLRMNPTAAKIKLEQRSGYVYGTLTASVQGSDKEKKESIGYREKGEWFLVLPEGVHVLEVAYYYTKKHALRKGGTHITVGPTKVEVTLASQGNYTLSYSIEENKFSFDETI